MEMITSESFHLAKPDQWRAPIILTSPHSGREYTSRFLQQSCLNSHEIRMSEDLFMDDMITPLSQIGVPVLSARAPRAFLDLNRSENELDVQMFEGPMDDLNTDHNAQRMRAGLGVIPRIVSQGKTIYKNKLDANEARWRLKTFYHPFHQALQDLIDEARAQFGYTLLIDCHSMPSRSSVKGDKRMPDYVIGDHFGASCFASITTHIKSYYEDLGDYICINKPFSGGYITQHYGAPQHGVHAVQLEFNRALYANEVTYKKTVEFDNVQRRFARLVQNMTEWLVKMETDIINKRHRTVSDAAE